MWKSSIKAPAMPIAARRFSVLFFLSTLFPVLTVTGCFIIDLGGLTAETYPADREQIIGTGEELWIRFSRAPARVKAEELLSVEGRNTGAEGDLRWEENRLFFRPVPPLKPGVRYLFRFSGTLETAEGGHFDVDLEVPFFAGSRKALPHLIASQPADGDDLDCEGTLVFTFSRSMDPGSFARALSIEPYRGYGIGWNGDFSAASVTPEERWEPNTLYTWSIDDTAEAGSGEPLASAETGRFITRTDTVPPRFVSLLPARQTGGSYLEMPSLARDDVIKITFTEDVDTESLDSAFTVRPALPGSFSRIASGVLIYTPENFFVMGAEYFITLGTEVEDRAGNRMQEEVRLSLRPGIPPQEVLMVRFTGAAVHTLFPDDWGLPVFPVIDFTGGGPEYTQTVEIELAEPMEEPFRSVFTRGITLEAYFPPSLLSPVIENITWGPGNSDITFQAEGFVKSPPAPGPEKALYRLTIPGGPDLSINRNGSYLEEEVQIIIEAERE